MSVLYLATYLKDPDIAVEITATATVDAELAGMEIEISASATVDADLDAPKTKQPVVIVVM